MIMKTLNWIEAISTKNALAGTAIAGTGMVGTEQGWLNEYVAIILAAIAFGNLILAGIGKYIAWRHLKRKERKSEISDKE